MCLSQFWSAQHLFSPSRGIHAGAPDGWMVPQDSKRLLPILTSALCSCMAEAQDKLFSLGCIPNNGLTYVPLINTSADKLASHTSILVWGRLISGADTGLSVCVTCTPCVGVTPAQWKLRLITKVWRPFSFSTFDWKLDFSLESCCSTALLCECSSGWHTVQPVPIQGP